MATDELTLTYTSSGLLTMIDSSIAPHPPAGDWRAFKAVLVCWWLIVSFSLYVVLMTADVGGWMKLLGAALLVTGFPAYAVIIETIAPYHRRLR